MKLYNTIYADPPWSYNNKNTGGSLKSGASAKYPTLSLAEIKAMQLPLEKDAVLFLWATVPLLPEAFEVMKAWGFQYKTMLTWRKIMSLGMGYWYRGQCEHLLFGTRGELIDKSVDSMYFPLKLELFARGEAAPGWDVYGNQVVNSIEL